MNEPRAMMPNRPSDSTLAALPARVLRFLFALATRAPIRAQMRAAGFHFEDHAEGLNLVHAVYECRDTSDRCSGQLRSEVATTELHQWVTTHFRRFRRAMERLHPEAAVLFTETDSRYPMQSVLAMHHLIEELRTGDDFRNPALLATLEQRGLDSIELDRLACLVTDAQSMEGETSGKQDDDKRDAELVALYAWYRDWSETARRVVTRKDYRTMLGLGGKRDFAEE